MKNNRRRVRLVAMMLVGIMICMCVKYAQADAPMNAKKFQLTGQYTGNELLKESDREQGVWYRIDIPSDGLLELKIMSYCSERLRFELKNEDLSTTYKFIECSEDYVGAGDESNPATGMATKALSKGTYYLHIWGTTGKYRLCGNHKSYGVTTTDSSADSHDSPYTYEVNGKEVTGAFTENDKEDWYKIIVAENGNYTFKVMSYCSNGLNYTLSTANLTTKLIDNESIYGATESEPVTKTNEIALSKGTYYLKINSGSVGKYVMSVSGEKILKTPKLSVTAKKNKKKITVKTVGGAKVTVSYGGKKYTKTSSGSGKATFSMKKKLKKGKKVKVTVKKDGYKTRKTTVKVK